MGLCYLVFTGKAKHSVLFVSSSSCEVGDFMDCLIFFYEIVTLCMFLGLILMTLSGGCLTGKEFFFMYFFCVHGLIDVVRLRMFFEVHG